VPAGEQREASRTVLAYYSYYIWCRRAVLLSGLRGGKGGPWGGNEARCTPRTPPCVAHRAHCAVQSSCFRARVQRQCESDYRARALYPRAPDEDLTPRAPDEQQLSGACGRGRFPRAARRVSTWARALRRRQARSRVLLSFLLLCCPRPRCGYASEDEGRMARARGGARLRRPNRSSMLY